MPLKNAFSTPDLGVLQRRLRSKEIVRFGLDSGKSRKVFVFVLLGYIFCKLPIN